MTICLWIVGCLFIYLVLAVICMIAALEIDNYLAMYRIVHGETFFYKFLYCSQTVAVLFICPLLFVASVMQTAYTWLHDRIHRT